MYDLLLVISLWPPSATLRTASVLSVAQTTVLIGVNPCRIEGDLKKQSQFAVGLNWHKVLYER